MARSDGCAKFTALHTALNLYWSAILGIGIIGVSRRGGLREGGMIRCRILVAIATLGLIGGVAWAAPTGSANIAGRYMMVPGFGPDGKTLAADGPPRGVMTFVKPKLKGAYKLQYEETLKSREEGRPRFDRAANCLPANVMGAFNNPYPVEIIVKPDQVIVLFEGTDRVRRIYTDGRGHPAKLRPSTYGHSVGRWEGAALVVDTIGVTGDTSFADALPHSPALHVTERLTRVHDGKDLEWDAVLTDPQAIEGTANIRYLLRGDNSIRMMEYSCGENNRNKVNAQGETTAQVQ